MFDLTGKVALVTGSSQGLGAAMARCLAEAGADVAVNYTSEHSLEKAEKVAEYIRGKGRRAIIIRADVSKEEDVIRMIETVDKEFGRLDILCNNAGVNSNRNIYDMTLEDWQRVQNTNITYADDTLTTVLSWGKLPHLMRSGAAHVRLRVASGTFTVHALASDGERLRAVPATFAAGALSFTADVAATAEATWLYEIVRQPSPSVMILR